MTNFTYGLTLSDRGNPVLFIKYTSQNNNVRYRYGGLALRYGKAMLKAGHIDQSTWNNLRSLKKTTDEDYLEKNTL